MTQRQKSLFSLVRAFPRRHVVAIATISVAVAAGMAIGPEEPEKTTRTTVALAPPERAANATAPVAVSTPDTTDSAQTQPTLPSAAKIKPANPAGRVSIAESSPEKPEAAPPATPKINWQAFEIESGDSLSSLFQKAGFSDALMLSVVNGEGKAGNIERLYAGETIRFGTDANGDLTTIRLKRDRLESLVIDRKDGSFYGSVETREPDIQTEFATAEIDGSLYLAAREAGLNDRLTMEIAGLFGWEIDFVYDIRRGDRFEVLYETKHLDGERIGTGDILAASFINQGERITALRYTDQDGDTDYYTPDGRSIKKEFLRTPINARVSSPFNLQRRHPVLGTVRPHEGTDYAAAVGTPIKASGDGRVRFSGWKGGYGRTVVIQHGDNISTLYAHMSRIKSNIGRGTRVEQGEIIGYVGASGMVTGAHLHYEYRINGAPRNSRTVSLPEAKPVPDSEMPAFRASTRPLLAALRQEEGEHQLALGPRATDNDG
ncbi:peptidoglycan DD-metalloendopeptidase family protein [Tamilnaduibacter salinus]|nr:peptidoglycan DD-metalloendopeptidase family protein [Tamilnaduibacter salinus]